MRSFFKTVAIVTVFSISEKFLGFLYRIYLSQTIGSEGIGLYSVALSVFSLIFTVCCSGVPITVSRLMTKYKAEGNHEKVQRVISSGLLIVLLTSLPVCLILFLFGKNFTFLFADRRCFNIFIILLPGLVFSSVYSVLRGVFWGNKDFLPYSIIELLEEICMIVFGILLIERSTDVYDGAYKAGIAVIISFTFSFSLATFTFFFRKNKLKNPLPELKPLFLSSLPITAMRTANTVAVSLVSIILPLRLIACGISESQAMSMFGSAVGQAIPLLFIPTTLIGSFTLVLVPEMAEDFYKHRHFYLKRDVEKALKFSTFLTCLFIPVFTVCGNELGILIFKSPDAGNYLSVSSFLMLFMSLSSISTSMLNSIGLEKKTLIYFISGSCLMLACIWFLPKYLGIYSLLVGFSFVYGLTSILNLRLLDKNCTIKPVYKKFTFYSFLLIFPTTLLGLMLEKLLLPVLGTLFTLLCCSGIMMTFHSLLYLGFNMIDFDVIRRNIKLPILQKITGKFNFLKTKKSKV